MKAAYNIADRKDSRSLTQFLSGEWRAMLPILEHIHRCADVAHPDALGGIGLDRNGKVIPLNHGLRAVVDAQ